MVVFSYYFVLLYSKPNSRRLRFCDGFLILVLLGVYVTRILRLLFLSLLREVLLLRVVVSLRFLGKIRRLMCFLGDIFQDERGRLPTAHPRCLA